MRPLFGIGLHLGLGFDDFSSGLGGGGAAGTGAGGLGAYLRLGAQLDDPLGIEAEIDGGTLYLVSYTRGALTFDYTPADWFTVAVGPSTRVDYLVNCGGSGATTVESIGGTVRLDFHVEPFRARTGRDALTVGLVGDLGETVGSNDGSGRPLAAPGGVAWGLYATVGWAHY